MNCRQIRELLPLYADGDLEDPDLGVVSGHLAGCEECRARLAVDRELTAALAEMSAPVGAAAIAPAVRRGVMTRVERERRWGPLRRRAESLGNATVWVAVSAVTALLLVALAITWRSMIERRARQDATPAGPYARLGWQVVRDEVIAAPYYWVIDGERVDRTPQLSPDGTQVAYLPTVDGAATDVDRLVVRDLRSGQDLDLTPDEGYSYTSVRWSPDSRSLAFVKHRYAEGQATVSELWRVDADGRNLKLLYRPVIDLTSVQGPAVAVIRWSADGQYLELTPTAWGSGGPLRTWSRVKADGSGLETQIEATAAWFGTSEDALVGETIYSPTGGYALHVIKSDALPDKPADAPASGHSLVLYDLQTRRATVLGAFAGTVSVSESSVSPDGEWICFRVATPQAGTSWMPATVWVMRRDGSGLRQVMHGDQPLDAGDGPFWADGGRAYFEQPVYVSAIWLAEMDAQSGEANLITPPWHIVDIASVSRDGRRLLAIKGGPQQHELRLLELAPGPAAESTPAPMPTTEAVAEPAFGPPVDLAELLPSVGGSYWLSPDGRWVAYVAPKPPGDEAPNPRRLVARNLETGESETLLDNLPGEAGLSWLPDSRRLAIVIGAGGGQGGAVLLEGLGEWPGRTLAVPEGDVQGFGEVAVSPDGGRVAFTVYHDAGPAPVPRVGIEVIDLQTSGHWQVVEPDFFIGHLAWTPDGSQIVYFKGKGGTPPDDGESYVASADGGGEPQLVIARARLAAWSPDGRQGLWLGEPADERGKGDLVLGPWPAEGPPAVLVKGADAFRVTWVRDCCVVYAQEGALYLLATGSDAPPQPRRLTPEGEWATAPEWRPGKGLAYLATREGSAAPVLRLLPLAGERVPTVETVAGLVVEKYAVADEQTGFPRDVEGTDWLGPEILDRRRPWREMAAQPAGSDEALRASGYGTQEWDPALHANQAPVLVGQDVVSVENDEQHRQYAVRRGDEIVYTFTPDGNMVSEPVKGLWSWEGHWVLEVNGQVLVDGRDLNQELGYDEIFGWRLLQGRPFYFFRQGESVGVCYNGQVLPQQYEQVPHYQCCSGAAYSARGNDTMVWFFGLREGTWHYVEMGIYGATAPEEPTRTPAPEAAGWEAWASLQEAETSGALHGRLTLLNVGCTAQMLQGQPQVTLVDGQGQIVPTIQGELENPAGENPVVTLQLGQRAVAEVYWANYCGEALVAPLSLRLVLPGPGAEELTAPLETQFPTPRCNVEAPASALSVGPFQALEPSAASPICERLSTSFLPAAAAFMADPQTQSLDGSAVITRLREMATGTGLQLPYLARPEGQPEVWAGSVTVEDVGAGGAASFLLWRQDGQVRYEYWPTGRKAWGFHYYLLNPPRALRLVEAGGTLEMGLITGNLGSTNDAWFVLARLEDGHWQEVWSPQKAAEGTWGSGDGLIEFTGPGIDGIRLVGTIPEDVPASRVFFEFGVFLKQRYESEWQRQGDSYVQTGGRIVPTPLTALADFIDLLQKGDPAGAAALATDASVVDAALQFSLGRRASGDGWLATRQVRDATEGQRIFFRDNEQRERSFGAVVVEQAGAWRVKAIERTAVVSTGVTATHSDAEIGYAIDYAANWHIQAESGWNVILTSWDPDTGPAVGGVAPDQAKIDILPTKPYMEQSLDAMVAQVEAGASRVLRKEQWDLAGVPAVRLQIVGEDGEERALLLTVINGRSLRLAGYGDLTAFDPVAQTLRPLH